jgi:tetratricopeptide (TPR) repeat protein
VSPSGAVIDLDRSAAKNAWFSWDSQAEVATQVAEDHWTVEMRIPITQDENDPLHQVIGHKPTKSLPWHLNLCRQRIRGTAREYSAFSPTGADHFHNAMKFAHFFDGNSFQFDAAEPDADFLSAMRAAADLAGERRPAEALAACTAAAEGSITEVQKSAALEQAAHYARLLHQDEAAADLAARIPIDAVKKTVLMQNLLDQSKAPQLIEQFGREAIDGWPFWKQGDGYFARGRAYAITKAGEEARVDFIRALEWTSETRIRQSIWQALGSNLETNLRDDTAALAAYRKIIEGEGALGSADQFSAVQGIARILTRHGEFDEALATLRKADSAKLRGFWRGSLLLAQGATLQAAGRKDEAVTTYRSVLADSAVDARQHKAAEEALARLAP